MNREEMFALARGQSCSLTEMKEKHCADSWDLFAAEEMHNFRMFTRLETTYPDQSHGARCTLQPHLLYFSRKT